MIVLENINKTYHNGAPLHVLKGIDLEIEKGELGFRSWGPRDRANRPC